VKFLVVTNKHELHPLANILLSEGQDVDVVVWKRRYEQAWSGRLNLVGRFSKGEMTRETWDPYKQLAKQQELTVITNVPKVREIFELDEGDPAWFYDTHSKEALTEPVRFGGWWWQGALHLPHVLVYDQGLWPGGLGPQLPGGVTLIRLPIDSGWQQLVNLEVLSGGLRNHQGLFNVQFRTEDTGELHMDRLELGWSWLQTPALLSNVADLSSLLAGASHLHLDHRYSVALPLSVPPFPVVEGKSAAGLPIQGLTEVQLSSTLWHDVTIDQEGRALRTAGLDGLLGISTGAANSLVLARGQALAVPQTLEVPELQYRPDLCQSVALAEAALENMGLVL
jgi:hypothetical protein